MNIKKANTIIEQISNTVTNWYEYAEQANVADNLKKKIGGFHLKM